MVGSRILQKWWKKNTKTRPWLCVKPPFGAAAEPCRTALFRSRQGSVLLFRGKLLVFKGVFIKKKKEKKQAPSEAGDFSNRKEIWWFISVSSLLFGARQPLPRSDSGDSPSANNGARRGRGPFPAGKRLVPVKSPVWC